MLVDGPSEGLEACTRLFVLLTKIFLFPLSANSPWFFFLSTERTLHEFCQHTHHSLQLNPFSSSSSIAILFHFILLYSFSLFFYVHCIFTQLNLHNAQSKGMSFFLSFFFLHVTGPPTLFLCSMSPNFHTLLLLTFSRQICTFPHQLENTTTTTTYS